MAAGIAAGSFTVYSAVFDKATATIRVRTAYSNTAGDARVVDETLKMK